ncbi:MAG: hypothetical protein E6G61_11085 [Actinobacteria bacterium]|nr:MAG: hypothetical protein E6G61_11085 [Actinomycetota bacterium]
MPRSTTTRRPRSARRRTRLRELKGVYDPTSLFHANANIAPACR